MTPEQDKPEEPKPVRIEQGSIIEDPDISVPQLKFREMMKRATEARRGPE